MSFIIFVLSEVNCFIYVFSCLNKLPKTVTNSRFSFMTMCWRWLS